MEICGDIKKRGGKRMILTFMVEEENLVDAAQREPRISKGRRQWEVWGVTFLISSFPGSGWAPDTRVLNCFRSQSYTNISFHFISFLPRKSLMRRKRDSNPAAWLLLKINAKISTQTATLIFWLWCTGKPLFIVVGSRYTGNFLHFPSFCCFFFLGKSILVIKSRIEEVFRSSWVVEACSNSFKLHPIYWWWEMFIPRTSMPKMICLTQIGKTEKH